MIYLASPYSHPDPLIREERFVIICKLAAKLIVSTKEIIFCPIAHSHPIAIHGNLEFGYDYWKAFDERMISFCDELWIAELPGWLDSVGIREEVKFASSRHKVIRHISLKIINYYVPDHNLIHTSNVSNAILEVDF